MLERSVRGFGHVGSALHPVWDGRPVGLGYDLDDVPQTGVLADGDGVSDLRLAAGGDDVVVVEATVGPHGELTRGAGIAHAAHRLAQEMGGAPGRVGPALAQPTHQHVAGSGGDGEERVIAPLASVVVALSALLAQPVGLADGGVQVDGQRIIARSGPSRPGPSQCLPAHPVQLAHVAPPETAQKGLQRGWRFHDTTQRRLAPASAQRVGVIDAVATGQGRRHQRQQLISRVCPTERISQVNVVVHQLAQSQTMGQSDRQDQPGIGYQAVIVESDLDAIRVIA